MPCCSADRRDAKEWSTRKREWSLTAPSRFSTQRFKDARFLDLSHRGGRRIATAVTTVLYYVSRPWPHCTIILSDSSGAFLYCYAEKCLADFGLNLPRPRLDTPGREPVGRLAGIASLLIFFLALGPACDCVSTHDGSVKGSWEDIRCVVGTTYPLVVFSPLVTCHGSAIRLLFKTSCGEDRAPL